MQAHTSENLKVTKSEFKVMLFCVANTVVQLFGIDIYIPSMPWIKENLHTTQMVVQLTIALYMLGAALSVLFSGPLSDKIGRKPVIMMGLIGMIAGGILCLFTLDGPMLLIGRIIQGIGVGFCMGANRAIVTDVFSAKKLAAVGAYFGTIGSISPLVAPVLGGYLEHYFNWRANFVVLTFCYIILLITYQLFFHETIHTRHPDKLSFQFVLKRYLHIIRQSDFRVFAICGGLTLGIGIAYATSAPYIFEKTLLMSPIAFGWLGIFVGAGNIAGKLTVPTFNKYFKMQTVLVTGLFIILFAGIFFAIALSFHWLSIPLVLLVVIATLFGQSYVAGNAFSMGVSPYRHMGGTANALLSFSQMALAFMISGILSFTSDHIPESYALAGMYIIIGGVCLLVFLQYSRKIAKLLTTQH